MGTLYEGAGVVYDSRRLPEEKVRRLGPLLLAHDPGTAWTYGLSSDVAGRLIEVVSGERLDLYPIVEDHVFIGTNAALLGPIRVGHRSKVGANAFVINRDVPAYSTLVGATARVVKMKGKRVDEELPRMAAPRSALPVEIEV